MNTGICILNNITQNFYKQVDNFFECEALYFRIQNLQKERKIYIDNLDNFYCTGLDFLISQKRDSAGRFFENVPIDELSSKAYLYMGERLYSAINDAAHLNTVLSHTPNPGFQDRFNQAIANALCAITMMD